MSNSVSVSLKTAGECYLTALIEEVGVKSKKNRKVKVKVIADETGLNIIPEGYDNFNNGIITLEIWDGKLRLLVWADKKSEEPTHIIDLEGAKQGRSKKCKP